MAQLESEINSSSDGFQVNDPCWIFSGRIGRNCIGRVIERNDNDMITVRFNGQKNDKFKFYNKKLRLNDPHLQQFNACTDELFIFCVCGTRMTPTSDIEASTKIDDNETKEEQKDRNDNDDDDSDSEMELLDKCFICNIKIENNRLHYYCPAKQCKKHRKGFILCNDCALDRIGLTNEKTKHASPKNETNSKSDEIKENKENENETRMAISIGYSDEPFANGTFKVCHLGKFVSNGRACVIKKFKDKHVMNMQDFEGDIACFIIAKRLIDKWNELGRVDMKFEIIEQHYCKTGPRSFGDYLASLVGMESMNDDNDDEEKGKMIMIPLEDGIAVVELPAEILKWFQESRENEILKEENKEKVLWQERVIIEEFLNGDFVKWNSNNGWCQEEKHGKSIQAFCHWTYHESKGQFLLCDAQGIKTSEKYILTDPCIVSNHQLMYVSSEYQRFGTSDTGRWYLLNWFRNHKCNQFCDDNWMKPTKEEIDTIPKRIITQIEGQNSTMATQNTIHVASKHREIPNRAIMEEDENYEQYLQYCSKDEYSIKQEMISYKQWETGILWNGYGKSRNALLLFTNLSALKLIDVEKKQEIANITKENYQGISGVQENGIFGIVISMDIDSKEKAKYRVMFPKGKKEADDWVKHIRMLLG